MRRELYTGATGGTETDRLVPASKTNGRPRKVTAFLGNHPGIPGNRSAPVPEELGSLRGDRGGSRRRPGLAFTLGARPPFGIGLRRGADHRASREGPRPVRHDRAAHSVRGRDDLQQLLRVRERQGRPVARVGSLRRASLDCRDRRRGPPAAGARRRRPHAAVSARGAHLPHAVRRGVVHGHPLARVSPLGAPEAGRAHVERPLRRLHDAARSGAHAGTALAPSSTGRTWRDCGSTRRCIR